MEIIKGNYWRWIGAVLLVLLALFSHAQNAPSREYQIKAVFLFNFAQFIEWPTGSFAEADSPLVIGVLGKDPFGSYLDETVKGEKINDHPLKVKRYKNISEVKGCHILFINPAKGEQIKQLVDNLKPQSILTVGDGSSFTQQGGMIGFFTEKNKIRIQINLAVTKDADLTISSKLLRVAEIVTSDNR